MSITAANTAAGNPTLADAENGAEDNAGADADACADADAHDAGTDVEAEKEH